MGEQESQKKHFERLVKRLGNAESYPHKPETVTHIQTHISHVFIVPPYVYKLKKPVDFGFLDYSTLSKRHEYCRKEIELNRRLSDDVYLGLSSINMDENSTSIVDQELPEESVAEYAVRMKLLEEEYFLHTYLEKDALTYEHLDRVVDKLADFYDSQDPSSEIQQFGRIENIKVNTDENFNQTHEFIGKTINRQAYQTIQYFTNQYYKLKTPLFESRIKENRIVDGHGDLHLEHIHITPENVQIYDCIEFNKRFRYGDLAADLAYLAMDLDFNNCWKEAQYFVEQISKKLDDRGLLQIIDFYKCYRAYVKGKVKSLQSGEDEVPQEGREKAAQTATEYFDLSLRYALLGSHPIVLVVMGRVGTGKSTLAQHLSQKLDIPRFSSDHIRKSLAGLPLQERTPEEKRTELYSSSMSQKTYAKLIKKAVGQVQKGQSAILDATFSNVESRNRLLEELPLGEGQVLFVEANAPDHIVKERLKDREQQRNVVSDARLEDFEKLDKKYSSPNTQSEIESLQINTNQNIADSIDELYTKFVEWNITRS